MSFKIIGADEIKENSVELFDKRWALLTAGTKNSFNTMTVSWGALGELWAKPMVTAYVRPSRYTFDFMEKGDFFTLSFFGEEYREQLKFCGVKSGRDVDKVSFCGFTPVEHELGCVYFEQAELVLVCRKLYSDAFKKENFFDEKLCEGQMKDGLHHFYMGSVEQVLEK